MTTAIAPGGGSATTVLTAEVSLTALQPHRLLSPLMGHLPHLSPLSPSLLLSLEQPVGVIPYTLHLKKKRKKRVVWTEDVVDNEGMNKQKSKSRPPPHLTAPHPPHSHPPPRSTPLLTPSLPPCCP